MVWTVGMAKLDPSSQGALQLPYDPEMGECRGLPSLGGQSREGRKGKQPSWAGACRGLSGGGASSSPPFLVTHRELFCLSRGALTGGCGLGER